MRRSIEELDISPELIKVNTIARDVTGAPDVLQRAHRIVASYYSRLAKPQRDIETVYAELCRDGYGLRGRSKTIAALTKDPFHARTMVSGTVRLVWGTVIRNDELEPIDAMGLMAVPCWPHSVDNRKDLVIGELGRFAIPEYFRTPEMVKNGVPTMITKLLFDTACREARRLSVRYLYSIMPGYVLSLVQEAGITSVEIDGATKRRDQAALELFETYSVYWKKMSPKLCLFADYTQ